MIALIVAFIFGYKVYNIKKNQVSKMMSISGIFSNMDTLGKDGKDAKTRKANNDAIMSNPKTKAVLVSAVAQEEQKKSKKKDS
jgi:uncharacterized protein (DUF2147 family)